MISRRGLLGAAATSVGGGLAGWLPRRAKRPGPPRLEAQLLAMSSDGALGLSDVRLVLSDGSVHQLIDPQEWVWWVRPPTSALNVVRAAKEVSRAP